MYRSCLKYASTLFCLSFTLTALASETGDMEIKSGLNQKFSAEIPLSLDPADNGRTQYRLIQKKNPAYSADTDPRPEIDLSTEGNKLKLSSQQALQDPRVNLVLEIRNPEGVQYKQYTVDLSQASDHQPLIVSPVKQRLPRKNPKNAKKPAVATLTPAKPGEKTTGTLASEGKTASPNDKTTQPTPPVATAPLHTLPATTEAASHPAATSPAPATPAIVNSEASATVAKPNPATPATQEASGLSLWVVIAAFIGGIIGVMGLQQLFKRKPAAATPEITASPTPTPVVETPVAEAEKPAAASLAPLQESQAQFERLLEAKRQEMAAMELLKAQAAQAATPPAAAASALEEEDNYGFDFDLPEFTPKQDS